MDQKQPTYADAEALLKEFTQSESLLRHAYAVAAAMRSMARAMGGDEEEWAAIGLIHDLDYEQFPQEHCQKSLQILAERGWPQEYIRAVASHGWGTRTDVRPETPLEKALYAVDELTGLVAATALVRPSRSVRDLEARSVLKKWKDKAFAAGVNRADIERGAQMVGMELKDLIGQVILGMREVADQIDL